MSELLHTPEWKAAICKEYLEENCSSYKLAAKYGINPKTVRRWTQRYKEHGVLGFLNLHQPYTSDFKLKCVKLYLSGEMSVDEIVAKYLISSSSVLRSWIKMYNANRLLKDYCHEPEVYMATTRKKTSIEERKEIVEYCINHNRNYRETASVYGVSYYQVHSWVKKYDEKGEDGLVDKRGHHKSDEELSELELLRRENARLKRKLEEQERIALLLKKVQEFERM